MACNHIHDEYSLCFECNKVKPMTNEIQTKRAICLSDSLASYAKSISPKSSISEGIRIALIEYKRSRQAKKEAH